MKNIFASLEITQAFSNLFSTYASLTGFAMMMRSMFNDLIPQELRSYITNYLSRFFTRSAPELCTITVDEFSGDISNQLFEAAETYLRTRMGPDTKRLKASKTPRQRDILASIEKGEEIVDHFDSIEVRWIYVNSESEKDDFRRYFEVSCEKKFRDRVLESYLPRVMSESDNIKQMEKKTKLYSRSLGSDYSGRWGSVYLEHPSTFETLALDPNLKKMIIDDLERFLRRKELYKKVGKAWKRGYLLYGPPGTGKSSLIAAMANYLRFDVYELELTNVYSNSELKRIFLSTSNRSILVIEDIDCSDETMDRARRRPRRRSETSSRSELTLSGILNCIDGLWSSCGDERIFIFTTNHKDRLDPALLRPGRMDVHIHLSYTTVQGFRILASNYLGLDKDQTHPLYAEIEPLIETTNVTPAEIAEELLQGDDPDVALGGLLGFLEKKKIEQEEEEESDSESPTSSSSSYNDSSSSSSSSAERERRRVKLRRRGLRLGGWRSC